MCAFVLRRIICSPQITLLEETLMIEKLLDVASEISTPWSLAAFAIAAIVLIVWRLSGRRGKNTFIAFCAFFVILAVGLIPIVAPAYLNSRGVFRVRVVVLDDHQMPTDNAKVTSSMGGEPKKIAGGWEFDIPAQTKPAGGKLVLYAIRPEDFLTGHADIVLADDFAPVITVQMERDTGALLKGIVVDDHSKPVEGALVGVFGFEAEAVKTGMAGAFTLHAHAADGQQVEVYAQKARVGSTTQWCQAGNLPVTVVLNEH